MATPEPTLVISPIGDPDADLTLAVSREVQRVFDIATETMRLVDDVAFAFDSSRRQYHSTKILEQLAANAPPHAMRVLAITEVDLFIPILTYVYGEAQLGGKAGIISIHRLDEGLVSVTARQTFHCRAGKEAVHELGHTFKLRHCREKTCIMHYCRSIRDVDRKTDQLCRYCQTLLDDEMQRIVSA